VLVWFGLVGLLHIFARKRKPSVIVDVVVSDFLPDNGFPHGMCRALALSDFVGKSYLHNTVSFSFLPLRVGMTNLLACAFLILS